MQDEHEHIWSEPGEWHATPNGRSRNRHCMVLGCLFQFSEIEARIVITDSMFKRTAVRPKVQ